MQNPDSALQINNPTQSKQPTQKRIKRSPNKHQISTHSPNGHGQANQTQSTKQQKKKKKKGFRNTQKPQNRTNKKTQTRKPKLIDDQTLDSSRHKQAETGKCGISVYPRNEADRQKQTINTNKQKTHIQNKKQNVR